jgi:hypothetical protein
MDAEPGLHPLVDLTLAHLQHGENEVIGIIIENLDCHRADHRIVRICRGLTRTRQGPESRQIGLRAHQRGATKTWREESRQRQEKGCLAPSAGLRHLAAPLNT